MQPLYDGIIPLIIDVMGDYRRIAMLDKIKPELLHTHEEVLIKEGNLMKKLFSDLGERFAERPGGYTRIYRLGQRPGDGARTALLELIGAPPIEEKEQKKDKKGKRKEGKAKDEKAEKKASSEDVESHICLE